VELYLHSSTIVHGVVLIKHRDNFTLWPNFIYLVSASSMQILLFYSESIWLHNVQFLRTLGVDGRIILNESSGNRVSVCEFDSSGSG
jgi:hypothetical protein